MTTAALQVEAPQQRTILWAMGKIGGASILSGLLSAFGVKIVASVLGPSSIALLQTLQQLRDVALTTATANGRTALVQGASALAGGARREFLRTVALLFAGGMLLVATMFVAAPRQVVLWSRLPAGSESLLPWIAVSVALLSVFVYATGVLNALQEIGTLAWLQLASPLTAALVAWPLARAVRSEHPKAIVLFLAIPAAVTVLAALIALQGHREKLRTWFLGSGRWWTLSATRHFLSISGAMLASGLIATTVLLAVRGSITRQQGLATTGQFDAAWNISMTHVTLILSSVQAYYLPALSAASNAAERGKQIRTMFLIATLATVPVIVTLTALKPMVVGILYSPAFAASPGFMRWTLLGDYLKVSSWVLATPMLATRELRAFLTLDLIAHGTFFGASMILSRFMSAAESASIGFLISYTIYFALCFMYARIRSGFRFGALGLLAWIGGLLLIIGASASAWSSTTVPVVKASLWIFLAISFSAGFAIYFRRRQI